MTVPSGLSSLAITNGDLAYRDVGAGTPLVLLHGGALDHRMWDQQVPAFAPDYRVVVPDARGHGWSSTPTAPFRHCDDLADLLRRLDLGPAILVGLSMGAGTAVDTTLEYPDRVRALVVSGTGTSTPDFHDPWVHDIFAEWARTREAGDIDGWVDAFLLFAAGPHRDINRVDPDVVRRLREMATRTITTHAVNEPPLPVPVPGTWERAPAITVPVLAIHGGADAEDHIRMAERLVDTVPDGRAETIDGTAHYPNMERPETFNNILADFLRNSL